VSGLTPKGEKVISVYITILLFSGFVFVFLAFYYCKVRLGSDLSSGASLPLPQLAGEQNRKHPRADIHWPVSMETPDGTVEGEMINISLGGAFICCSKPFPLKDVFHLTVAAPENEPVAATAQVVWSNVNVPEEKVVNRGMGVRFIKMSERHLQLVRKVVQGGDPSPIPQGPSISPPLNLQSPPEG
jgi:uncharacterized protein (TIGR02266 family)